MRKIRKSIFETNSSSTHSLTIGSLDKDKLSNDYEFESIKIYPQAFGYDDIVAPFIGSNHFPCIGNDICFDCKWAKVNNYRSGEIYDCTNPDCEIKFDNDFSYYDRNKCEIYNNAQKEEMDNIINDQSPNVRASALFACIVCMNNKSIVSEQLCKYFDNLFKICNIVYFDGHVILPNENREGYWKTNIRRNNWGDYESNCWMELHDTSLEYKDVENIISDDKILKTFLFGKGSYAAGDRCG